MLQGFLFVLLTHKTNYRRETNYTQDLNFVQWVIIVKKFIIKPLKTYKDNRKGCIVEKDWYFFPNKY